MNRLIALLCTGIICACNNTGKNENSDVGTGRYSGPPYTIRLEEVVNKALPDLHSYTHGIYGDKIIMIGGRTNGLHNTGYNFYQSQSNTTVYVVDTRQWSDPAQWAVKSIPAAQVQLPGVDLRQLRANNAEFFTDSSVLYIVGGMLNSNVPTRLRDPKDPSKGVMLVPGAKPLDGAAPAGPETLPFMTAVNMPDLINTVMNGTPMPPASIRQVRNDSLRITGGELEVMNGKVYLVFGWNFNFTDSTDQYSHQVRTFTYTDNGQTLSISPISVCRTCTDRFASNQADSGIYRRRDGTMSPAIDPSSGNPRLMYYGGVFKNGNTDHSSTVIIGDTTAAEMADVMMLSNIYTCQTVPLYSTSRKQFYATLLGGMRNGTWTGGPVQKPVRFILGQNVKYTSVPGDFSTIPFTNQFTTMVLNANNSFQQYMMPDSFPPTITPVVLPAEPSDSLGRQVLPPGSVTFNGTESAMLWTLQQYMLPNGVVDYDAFIKANPGGGAAGYLHGGILSALINVFGQQSQHYSVASNRLFRVKIIPLAE